MGFSWDKKAMMNLNEMNVSAGTDWPFHLSSLWWNISNRLIDVTEAQTVF